MQREILDHGLLQFSLDQVANFPQEEIDEDILLNAAEIIQLSVSNSPKNMELVLKKNGLKEVAI